jgi:Rrf2 family nitric oxide-sensitive transcriptional repressor
MQLTSYTDYSLRMLLYLALHEDGGTIARIADFYGVSKNHLIKVSNHLTRLGYIDATRGRSGGLKLSGTPEEINIGEVVEAVEPNFYLVECFNQENNTCPITSACGLIGILGKAHQSFMDVLKEYTLRQLLNESPNLRQSFLLDDPIDK